VLDDYVRLLQPLVPAPIAAGARPLLLLLTGARHPLPGAGATPWQFEGVARALRAAGVNSGVVEVSAAARSAAVVQDASAYAPIAAAYGLAWRAPGAVAEESAPTPDQFVIRLAPCDPLLLSGGRAPPAALATQLRRERRLGVCSLTVVDATTIVAPHGVGRPEVRNLLLASMDRVALAAVTARLLGIDPCTLAPLQVAAAQGLGCADLERIEIAGARELLDPASLPMAAAPFDRAPCIPALLQRIMRRHYYWPQRDRPLFDDWLWHTGWGRLFLRYQRAALF
jgi:hypothetical protein